MIEPFPFHIWSPDKIYKQVVPWTEIFIENQISIIKMCDFMTYMKF